MNKSIVLSVSLGKGLYRHIQIDENNTLYDLHSIILESFDFDDDHLHAFYMNNRIGDISFTYVSPFMDIDFKVRYSDEVNISKFGLTKGSKFIFLFDFGEYWKFQITVLKTVNERTSIPKILKSVGEISQYGDDDEW